MRDSLYLKRAERSSVRMFLTAQSDTHLEETALAVPLGGQTDVTCRHVASVVVSVRLSAEPSMQEGKKHTHKH